MDLKTAAKDFQGLNVRKYGEKLEEVKDIKLLDFLKEVESNAEKPRTTVLDAIDAQRAKVAEDASGPKGEEGPHGEPQDSNDANMSEEKGTPGEDYPDGPKGEIPESPEGPKGETGGPGDPGVNLEEIQDENLKPFEEEVAKINDIEKLEELYEIEKRDDHRKGAFEILGKRLEELRGYDSDQDKQVISYDLDHVRKHRLQLDRLGTKIAKHLKIDDDLEIGKKVFMAKCWLGKMLGELGSDNPYAGEDKIKSEKDIPPTADADNSVDMTIKARDFSLKGKLDAVIELREELEDIATSVEKIYLQNVSREANIARTNSWGYIREAKFLLGQELSNMRS